MEFWIGVWIWRWWEIIFGGLVMDFDVVMCVGREVVVRDLLLCYD